MRCAREIWHTYRTSRAPNGYIAWFRLRLRVGEHFGRSEELVSRCVECDLAEPESLASLGSSAPGVVDGILSTTMRPRIWKVQPRMFPQGTSKEQSDLRILMTEDMGDMIMVTITNMATKAWWLNHDLIVMWW